MHPAPCTLHPAPLAQELSTEPVNGGPTLQSGISFFLSCIQLCPNVLARIPPGCRA